MKFYKAFFAVFAASVIVISCKKELSNEDGALPDEVENSWEFTEAGAVSGGVVDTAFVQTVGTVSTLSILGSTSGDTRGQIFLQVVGESISPGIYTNPLVFFQYAVDGNVVFQSNPTENGAFTIEITVLDSNSVTGTFTGTVKDANGNDHTITDGKFTSPISYTGGSPDQVETGQLTVWTREICSGGGPVEIRVGGQTGTISQALTAEPQCGADGTAVFILVAGNYTVEAICGTDTSRVEVTVGNNCTVLEIDLQNPPLLDDYFPLLQGSSWNYADLENSANTHTVTIEGNELVEDKMYTKFVSTLGDVFHYFKKEDTVFQLRKLDFQGAVSNPPTIEMVILLPGAAAGQSWETGPMNLMLAGMPVVVNLVSTIDQRDFSIKVNDREYHDCISVETQIMFSSDGGATFQPGSVYYTIFSKGNGIIYYYDLNRNVEWGASGVSINL